MVEGLEDLAASIVMAGFAAVGLEEYVKNFLPKKRTRWHALIMPPLAVACYCAAEMLPRPVIGSLLTVGTVQICYETLIQGLRALVERAGGKAKGKGEAPPKDAPPPPPPPAPPKP